MNSFCPFCEKTTSATVVEAVVDHVIKGVEVAVNAKLIHCGECGNEFNSPELGQDIAALALEAYRKKAGLLTPEQIRAFRATFDLTQQELARVLGWGITTLSRYENGALQDEAHDRALRLIMRPEALLTELKQHPEALSPDRRAEVLKRLHSRPYESSAFQWFIREYVVDYEPSIYSGYRAFDAERFKAMALHFCKTPGVPRTKLNKLLWYADFLAFRSSTVSISGARYAHLPHGPAPDNYATLLAWMTNTDRVLDSEEVLQGHLSWENLVSCAAPDYSLFSNRELGILARVAERFKDDSARTISDTSHQEAGFRQTSNGEFISYAFANELRISPE